DFLDRPETAGQECKRHQTAVAIPPEHRGLSRVARKQTEEEMNTQNALPQSLPSHKPPRTKSAKRQCSHHRYAVYPNTGRCTNYECPRYRRKPGAAMTAALLVHEFAKPELFHGRHWGCWTLDTERFCLVFEAQPTWRGRGRDRYLGYFGHYEI